MTEKDQFPPEVAKALGAVAARSKGGPLPDQARVTFNFHPDALCAGGPMLAAILDSGQYRSQFLTGTSNGGLSAFPGGARWGWESRLFDGAYDQADAGLRPKYGALQAAPDGNGGSPRFGACHFRLKPGVLARTTFCYPDSYYEPEHFGTADRIAGVLAAARSFAPEDPLDAYVEAQVHGPVSIAKDAEALVLDPSYRGSAIAAIAGKLPCALQWHAGYRLSRDSLAKIAAYRGDEVAALAAAILPDEGLTPASLGSIRRTSPADPQLLKKIWHCMARFGWQGARPG